MSVLIDMPIRASATGEAGGKARGDRRQSGIVSPRSDARVDVTSNQDFLAAALGGPRRFHYASRDKLCVVSHRVERAGGEAVYKTEDYKAATVSLGIQAIHQAFAAHMPLSLTPDLLWYVIVSEVAEYVRQNPDRHDGLFTDTPGSKQTLVVRDDSLRRDAPSDWQRSIGLICDPLRAAISDYTMDLFVPRFSTTTKEAEAALLIALMDVVSPYYDFRWLTRCGIPQIRLEGEAADWRSLHFRADLLAREFDGLTGYFADLLPVLQTIAETASGMTPDEEFWRSIYKYDDRSGGPYVTGWITAFFAYLQTKDGPVFKGQHDIKDPFNWRRPMHGWG